MRKSFTPTISATSSEETKIIASHRYIFCGAENAKGSCCACACMEISDVVVDQLAGTVRPSAQARSASIFSAMVTESGTVARISVSRWAVSSAVLSAAAR